MKRSVAVFILICSLNLPVMRAQETYTGIVPGHKVFHPYLSLGSAVSFSVINNRKEVRGTYKPGLNFNIALHTRPWFYWSAEYTKFRNHNSFAITGIEAWNAELNGNFIFGVGQTNSFFKFLFGAGYLDWKGTYVGPSMHEDNKYYFGMPLTQHWISGNLGCGAEHSFGRNFTASMDFRMRFASEKKDLISISDTGFFIGGRWNIHTPDREQHSNGSAHRKTNSKRSGRIYKWMKNR